MNVSHGAAPTLRCHEPGLHPVTLADSKVVCSIRRELIRDTAKLKAVLSYHVIMGHVLGKDLSSGDVMTLQGSPLVVSTSPSGVEVNGARVAEADIVATNGVIHVIDAVIMPKKWQLLAAA